MTELKQIIKNCPLYEQYDYFNIGKCKNGSSCNGIYKDFCKDINNCLLKQIFKKCKEFQQPIYKGETKNIYIKNILAVEILNLLEIEWIMSEYEDI